RDALTVHSPIDGVVFHGKFHKGQWSRSALDSKLVPNENVPADEVFLTVVKARPLLVHVTVDEKDVYLVKPGLKGTARLPFNPDRKLPARVTKVAAVPAAPGKFDAQLALDLGPDDANLAPGMACTVKFVPYSKKDAITVPTESIQEEDDKSFVYVAGRDNK